MSESLRRRDLLPCGVLALASCRSPRGAYFGNNAQPSARRLVFEMGAEPGSLDPAQCIMDKETYVQPALFEGLTSLHPVTAEPIAALATHYQVADDFTKFTFFLRGHASPRGVRLPNTNDLPAEYRADRTAPPDRTAALWSDGRKVTAEDFVYAWRRIMDPATAALLAPVYFTGVRDTRALDDFTFQVNLSRPDPIFLKMAWLPAFAAVPRHAFKRPERTWTSPPGIISSGPFVLLEWRPKNRIVLRKNPRYYEVDSVAIDELVFLPTVDGATRMNLYKTGETQLLDVRAVPPVFLRAVSGARDARKCVGCRTVWYSVNTKRPPLDNVLVRYALNMAIDRAAITRAFGAGRIPARRLVPPLPGYVPEENGTVDVDGRAFDVRAFDVVAARAILAKAPRHGRLRIPITLHEDPSVRQLSEIVQQQLRANLDVDVALNVQEANSYWTQTCIPKSYEGVVVDVWTAAAADPYDFLLQFGPAQYACAAWADKKYDAMLAAAQSTSNPIERMRKLAEVESYLMRQMPLLPVYHDSWLTLQKPYVRGFPLNLLGWPIFKYAWIDANWRP